MGEYILTYDIITSGLKASVFTPEGQLITSAYRPLQMSFEGTHAQQDAESWWDALKSTTHTLLQQVEAEQIHCLSFTDQVQVCLCVDARGRPLHDAITWSDARSLEVPDPFMDMDPVAYQKLTGQQDTPHSPARKLVWIRERAPEVYAKTFKMLGCKDFLAMRLTGEFRTDYSDASCTGVWDIENARWDETLCSTCQIDPDKLPLAVSASEVIGTVSSAAAQETGLSTHTLVVMGSGDFTCSAVGAGCVSTGDVYLNLGSSSWIATTASDPVILPDGCIVNNVHAVPGSYLPLANIQESGTTFKWLSSLLQYAGPVSSMVNPYQNVYPYDGMEALASQASAGSAELLFLPFLLGANAARYSPDISGRYLGLRSYHGRAELVRSALEGICYYFEMMRDILCTGTKPTRILATGIASHERLWLQMLSDIFGIPVENTTLDTTVDSIGAAIIAGNGAGLLHEWDIADHFWQMQERFEPNDVPAYREGYQRFLSAFQQLIST